jgi:hypothetical protein
MTFKDVLGALTGTGLGRQYYKLFCIKHSWGTNNQREWDDHLRTAHKPGAMIEGMVGYDETDYSSLRGYNPYEPQDAVRYFIGDDETLTRFQELFNQLETKKQFNIGAVTVKTPPPGVFFIYQSTLGDKHFLIPYKVQGGGAEIFTSPYKLDFGSKIETEFKKLAKKKNLVSINPATPYVKLIRAIVV